MLPHFQPHDDQPLKAPSSNNSIRAGTNSTRGRPSCPCLATIHKPQASSSRQPTLQAKCKLSSVCFVRVLPRERERARADPLRSKLARNENPPRIVCGVYFPQPFARATHNAREELLAAQRVLREMPPSLSLLPSPSLTSWLERPRNIHASTSQQRASGGSCNKPAAEGREDAAVELAPTAARQKGPRGVRNQPDIFIYVCDARTCPALPLFVLSITPHIPNPTYPPTACGSNPYSASPSSRATQRRTRTIRKSRVGGSTRRRWSCSATILTRFSRKPAPVATISTGA